MRDFGLCSLICSGGSPIPTSGRSTIGCGATLSRVTLDQIGLLYRPAGLGPRVLQDSSNLSFLLRPFPKAAPGTQLHVCLPPPPLSSARARGCSSRGIPRPSLSAGRSLRDHVALTFWVGLCHRFLWTLSCPSFGLTALWTPAV